MGLFNLFKSNQQKISKENTNAKRKAIEQAFNDLYNVESGLKEYWIDDAQKGFICRDTGNRLPNHPFIASGNIDKLWYNISKYIEDPEDLNKQFFFGNFPDGQGGLKYHKEVVGVLYFSEKYDCQVIMFKDVNGSYWHYVNKL